MPALELDPRDRIPHLDESRFHSLAKLRVWIIIIVIALFGGLGFYWYHFSQRPNYSEVYTQLGISSLPATLELQPEVKIRLDQLREAEMTASSEV
jgi:hypothetical protein